MTEHLEAGMQAIAAVIAQTTGKDIGRIPGSGAAEESEELFWLLRMPVNVRD